VEKIVNDLKENGYEYGVAIATKAEIEAGAACGQLAIIFE
jgi:septum formation inhibitor-activating ATPase MinD